MTTARFGLALAWVVVSALILVACGGKEIEQDSDDPGRWIVRDQGKVDEARANVEELVGFDFAVPDLRESELMEVSAIRAEALEDGTRAAVIEYADTLRDDGLGRALEITVFDVPEPPSRPHRLERNGGATFQELESGADGWRVYRTEEMNMTALQPRWFTSLHVVGPDGAFEIASWTPASEKALVGYSAPIPFDAALPIMYELSGGEVGRPLH